MKLINTVKIRPLAFILHIKFEAILLFYPKELFYQRDELFLESLEVERMGPDKILITLNLD